MLPSKKRQLSPNCQEDDDTDSGCVVTVNDQFQRPNEYLKLLPISQSCLAEDADTILSEIKDQLTAAVLLLDIKQGAVFWSSQLDRYMKIFGLRFSKQEHIDLVRLHYELIVSEDQEARIMDVFVHTFSRLLKRRHLLSPEDLSLPWRPVYKLWKLIKDTKFRAFPEFANDLLNTFIQACRTYFPVESTMEMIAEWKHLFSPLNYSLKYALGLLELFLPTLAPLEHHSQMYRLWFDEYMGLYTNLDGSINGWDAKLVSLFTRLAADNIGLIDWEPHLATVFSCMLKAIGLPVGPAAYQVFHSNSGYTTQSCSLWVVAMISPSNSCMKHIDEMITAIAPFIHPSNDGWYQGVIQDFICQLCASFTNRVQWERYEEPRWDDYIPDDQKLTDDQITQFVDIVRPLIFTGLFCKAGVYRMTTALSNLSFLQPERVLPQLTDILYSSLENLTEPYRLEASLIGITDVTRAMMICEDSYPEGKLHIIPILERCLPGIDSNDWEKTKNTLHLIARIATLISITDCSDAQSHRSDLSTGEKELCAQTAGLQDFLFLFIDRLLLLIEGLSLAHQNTDKVETCEMESRMESLVLFATTSVFRNTSIKLFKPAFQKIWRYMSGRVFEVVVAGRLAAAMIYGAANARPAIVFPEVIPYCCQNILEHTNDQGYLKDPEADNSLLWNLLLLSQVVGSDGAELVKYADDIVLVLNRTLHMTNYTAHTLACNILQFYTDELVNMQPRSVTRKKMLDSSRAEFLLTRDWGMACGLEDLSIDWCVPAEREFRCLQSIVETILLDELKYLDDTEHYEREELTRRLRVITECIKGAGKYMPPLDSQTHTLDDEGVIHRRKFVVRDAEKTFLISVNGENARNRILCSVRLLTSKLLDKIADSAKPLHQVCRIYGLLLFGFGAEPESEESTASMYKAVKRAYSNPLIPDGGNIRYVQIKKAALTLCRIKCAQLKFQPITELHVDVCHDLMNLATSNYDHVQVVARGTLAKLFTQFKGSEKLILPALCTLLTTPPPRVTEEQFKGALGLALNSEGSNLLNTQMCLATHPSLDIACSLWPAILQAQHSDKPSIQHMIEKIKELIIKTYDMPLLGFKVSIKASEAALNLRLSCDGATDLDLSAGQLAAQARTDKYTRSYHDLLRGLLELLNSDKLQWKHREFGLHLIQLLQRADVSASLSEVKLFCDSLVDATPCVRKVASEAMEKLLYYQKRRHTRQYASGTEFPTYESFQFSLEKVPNTEEAWNSSNFVEKAYWGCMNIPKQVLVTRCAPPPTPDELADVEKYILERFTDEHFTRKLFHCMTLVEVNDGDLHFNHLVLFQFLARNYGPVVVDCCKPAISILLTDTDHKTEKSRQRLVAEFVSGVIRGSKYWTFKQVMELFDWAIPIIKQAITNIADEVVPIWASAFRHCSTAREPKKLYRIFELLMDELKVVQQNGDSSTSLEIASRLFFLQCSVGRQHWRVPELNRYMLRLSKELLTSPSLFVRTRVGSVICASHQSDLPCITSFAWNNPIRADMAKFCLPLVKNLVYSTDIDLASIESHEPLEDTCPEDAVTKANQVLQNSHAALEQQQNGQKKLLIKTVLSWLEDNFYSYNTLQPWTEEILCFLPMVCQYSADFSDPELRSLSMSVAKYMSKALLPPRLLLPFIDMVKETMNLKSWHARVAIVEMLQSMMFLNQFHLHRELRQRLQDLVLGLLSDDRIEVRLGAAETLSGGLQFKFFLVKQLLDHFKNLVAARPKTKTGSKEEKERRLHRCHTGVLGLGAIVNAYPYEVPEFIPDVLMILSDHIHDAQPIQQTVKDVLSNFRRTHLDSWLEHKQKFTFEQLMALADLSVSANYYA